MKKENNTLRVREIEAADIPYLVDYWLYSDPEHLVAMGVDLDKLPKEDELEEMLGSQLGLPLSEKKSYALIWEQNGEPVGHCNVNQIEFGKQAHMHLHLWQADNRKAGIGSALVKKSIPVFFENLELETLICEPYTLNPAPNKTLEKIGFTFIKSHTCVPGYLNFEQEVNRWEMTHETFKSIF